MNWKNFTLTLLCALSLPPLAAQKRTDGNPTNTAADTAYVFRFVPEQDMFYVPYRGNGEELTRLETCVEQQKANCIWESSLKLCWSFGHKGKEGNK